VTPAVKALDTAQVPYRLLAYDAVQGHDLGMAAAHALALEPTEVFKTLVAELDGRTLVVAVIPVASKLSLKKLARAANARSARLADVRQVERATGYVTGGISPIGQKKRLATYLASECSDLTQMYISAGKRGLEIAINPADLVRVSDATLCELSS